MLFWKIDDETIRCLINRDEISQMGYDLETLSEDHIQMDEFLDAIVRHSKNYLNWNTDNGIQTYAASPLPSDQFLLTISCTFADDMIDRDLDQIRKMTKAISGRITEDRIESIYNMTGEEKEEAFRDLARDLQQICSGNPDGEEGDQEQSVEILSADPVEASQLSPIQDLKGLIEIKDGDRKGETDPAEQKEDPSSQKAWQDKESEERVFPPKKMSFSHFSSLVSFVSVLNHNLYFPSSLYKDGDNYILLVSFPRGTTGAQASSFVLTAEEYGAVCSNQTYDASYYHEHGRLLIEKDGIRLLSTM
jgi:negative regulator of genetic competence, sporulation and motility